MDIKKFIKEKQWKNWKKDQWLILFLAGILLLVIALPSGWTKQKEKQKTESRTESAQSSAQSEDAYVSSLEKQLEDVLEQMEGAGRVKVMITLKDNGKAVVEKDISTTGNSTQETDSAGGTRSITENSQEESTVFADGEEKGTPFISKETAPAVEGVLVVAQGGGDTQTAGNICEAVEALFGVEAHKIKVVKMNMQEESE